MLSNRNSLHNQKAKLAADYNDLLKELSSPKMSVVGCYDIGETIGVGTYGKVKLGTHQLTGQRVAIKKISKDHAPLMAREIHHHRQLRHPNIVMLYEILTTETAIFVVCEYCPNGELFDLLTRSGRFSEEQARVYFGQLVDAVKHCHDRGIVHRDLKLENILLDAKHNVKICDFGFTRQTDDKQLLDTFCGSLAYSAPEIIRRQKYTGPETDIWSLGIILYTLLAGELPFDDDSEIVVERKIVDVDYQMPDYFSPDAKDLIHRILQRNPSHRLTMNEILRHPWLTNKTTDDAINDSVDDDCESVPSTRYSTFSDEDSIFSAQRHEEDYDSHSDVSSPRNSYIKSPLSPQWNSFGPSKRNAVIPPPRQQPVFPFGRSNAHYETRPSRYSAPTVSKSPRVSPYTSAASCRQSMPTTLRNPTYGNRGAMGPMEQRLFAALTAAGFDENTVKGMRSDDGNVLGTLWHMLMENLNKNQDPQQQSAVHTNDGLRERSYPAMDKGIQTDGHPPTETQDKREPPLISETAVPVPVPVPVPMSKSSSTTTSFSSTPSLKAGSISGVTPASDKAGWLTSVKSWFGPAKDNTGNTKSQRSPTALSVSGQKTAQSVYSTIAKSSLDAKPPPFVQAQPLIAPPPAAHNKPSLDSYYKASNAFGPAKSPITLSAPRPPADTRPAPAPSKPVVLTTPAPATAPASPAASTASATSVEPVASKNPVTPATSAPVAKPVPPSTAAPVENVTSTQEKWYAQCPSSATQKDVALSVYPPMTTTRSTPTSTQVSSSTVPDIHTPPSIDDTSDDDGSTEGDSPATSISSEENVAALNVPPKPTPTRSWPLAMREAPMKRFEFAPPRSRLANYGVYDGGRGKSLGAKVIIEEEEEEEE